MIYSKLGQRPWRACLAYQRDQKCWIWLKKCCAVTLVTDSPSPATDSPSPATDSPSPSTDSPSSPPSSEGGKWTKIFSQDTIGGLFKVERSIGSHPNVILNFSRMKRLSVRILTIQKPPYSPDWTSWSSSEERGKSFTSRSSILNWTAVTSGYKHLTLLKPTLLRDLSQSALITRLMVSMDLGEDSDFVQGKIMP